VKSRNVAAVALVAQYLMIFRVGPVALAPSDAAAQAAGRPAPPKSAAQIWPTVSQAQSEAEYPEQWKAQRRAEAALAANAWILKVPHVKGMMPKFFLDKNVPNAIEKGIAETGVRVWVDDPQNVREVEGQVPSQLSGVPVVVEANPTDTVVW
jgi:hypothetical protein